MFDPKYADNDIFNAEIAKRDNIHQLSASNQSALSTGCSFRDSSSANPCAEIGETPVCCVVFSNIKDRDSISRILHVRNTFSHQSFMVSQIDHAVVQAHNALAKNTVLLPEYVITALLVLSLIFYQNNSYYVLLV